MDIMGTAMKMAIQDIRGSLGLPAEKKDTHSSIADHHHDSFSECE